MSLYALSWAFEQQLPPSEKIVLLALADCENGETLRCDPSQAHLASLSSLSERTVRDMLKNLVARELVTRSAQGSSKGGRRPDAYRLACRPPVDNSEFPAESAGRVTGKSEGGNRQAAAGIYKPERTGRDLDQVTEVTTERPVETSQAGSAGDGQESSTVHPSPKNLAALRGHAISPADVFASVGRLLAPIPLDDDGLERLAAEILAVAPTRVVNPTAYVVRAIRNDLTRPEWIARAWVIAAEIHVARANRRAAG